MIIEKKLRLFYLTSLFSVIFAVVGFSYNAWRLEASEGNNNIRVASFEIFNQLAGFEQILYSAYYDKNVIDGNPRKAWVKVGFIVDLAGLVNPSVEDKSIILRNVWTLNWEKVSSDKEAVKAVISAIDNVRQEIKMVLNELE